MYGLGTSNTLILTQYAQSNFQKTKIVFIAQVRNRTRSIRERLPGTESEPVHEQKYNSSGSIRIAQCCHD